MKIPFVFPLFPLLANAYTWQFTSQPRQCQNVSITVEGSGQPPYSLLLIPYGPTPLANNVEVRKIRNIPFSGNSNNLSFMLNYPESSSFVAVVSRRWTHFLSFLLISPPIIHRSATAAHLALVEPAFLSLFSNHPTRVVIMPPRMFKFPGFSTSIPLAGSHNVVLVGFGGISLLLLGARQNNLLFGEL